MATTRPSPARKRSPVRKRPAAAKPAAVAKAAAPKPVAVAVVVKPAAPAPAQALPTQPATAHKLAAPAKQGTKAKVKAPKVKTPKVKRVHEGFSMPKPDHALIGQLKARSARLGHKAKKGQLLRAGLRLLAGQSDAALLGALAILNPAPAK